MLVLTTMVCCESERQIYDGPNYIMFSSERHDLGVMDSEEWFEIPITATRTTDHDRNVGVELIAARSIEMNLVDCEYSFNINDIKDYTGTLRAGDQRIF